MDTSSSIKKEEEEEILGYWARHSYICGALGKLYFMDNREYTLIKGTSTHTT